MRSFRPHSQRGARAVAHAMRAARWIGILIVATLLSSAGAAAAQPPDPALLKRLAQHAATIDGSAKRCRKELLMEFVDGDGKVWQTKTRISRMETDGKTTHETVERATKDGKDVTADEQKEVNKEAESAKDADIIIPFLSDGYVYDQVAVDTADPSRVEISFTPLKPSKRTAEGNAWVDTKSGTILTVGAKFSKLPMFVDWCHFTIEFGTPTPVGPDISHVTFEAKASLLFIHVHVRGDIKVSDYQALVAPPGQGH